MYASMQATNETVELIASTQAGCPLHMIEQASRRDGSLGRQRPAKEVSGAKAASGPPQQQTAGEFEVW